MSTQISDLNNINANYQDVNDYNKQINTVVYNNQTISNKNLKYGEIIQDSNKLPTLIDIGPLCNDEYDTTSISSQKFWDKDDIPTNIYNANSVVNELSWYENNLLHSGGVQLIPGLAVVSKGTESYNENNVNFFLGQTVNRSNIVNNFNNLSEFTSNSGIAVDVFGYFCPDVTGAWQFILPKSDPVSSVFSYFWISNDNALYDYTSGNADINTKTVLNNNMPTVTINLTKGEYVPIRFQFVSKNFNFTNNTLNPLTVVPPNDSLANGKNITQNPDNGWNYFVSFVQNDTIYYKNLVYFGLIKDDSKQDRYNCQFVYTNSVNRINILNLKNNLPLQYIKVEIPTPVTFSGSDIIRKSDGNPMNIELPNGVGLNIDKATYGLDTNYNYIKTYQKPTMVDQWVPPKYQTKTYGLTDPVLPGKTASFTKQGYNKKVPGSVQVSEVVSVSQQKDVTAKTRQLVNGSNKLSLSDPNYANIYGNPIVSDKSPYINAPKNLTVKYSYSQDETQVTGKNIFLDPKNGMITIGFTFQGWPGTTLLAMDKSPVCNANCGSYKMTLMNNGNLSILDANNNEIGYINLYKYDKNFALNGCQVNKSWLNNPNISNSLNAGDQLSSIKGNKIISSDGRFKLDFESGKLIFTYCITPYSTSNNVKYTTTYNQMYNNQILSLYRISTRGIIGRKFLQESNSENSSKTLHYLPNNSNNVLQYSNFYNPFNKPAYPLTINNSVANLEEYNVYKNIDLKECSNKCISDPNNNCEHFYYIINNDKTSQCYADKTSESNPPVTFIKNNPNINESKLYKKTYKIKSTCGTVDDLQPLNIMINNQSDIDQYNIDYNIMPNAPNLTYYCGLDRYQKANQDKLNLYNKYFKEENVKEGMTALEDKTFNAVDPTANVAVTQKFPILNTMTKNFSQLQDDIGKKYDDTLVKLDQYNDASDKLVNPQYQYNGTDSLIPDKFSNSKSVKPNISLTDGMKKDVGVMLLQQNTMSTIATITAATFIIIAIFLGKE